MLRESVSRKVKRSRSEVASTSGFRFRSQELSFQYDRGETGQAWPTETTGGGVGLLDFDDDGDLDLFFAQGNSPQGSGAETHKSDVLLENQGGGKFIDVSAAVGLVPKGNGQGVVVADYDGDGDLDVYVTRYGANTLWRNERGKFSDSTEEAGVGCALWSLGAAFADFDADGDLDLFVANYFDFKEEEAPFAQDAKTGRPDYGMPSKFDGQPDVLYRNLGNGRFEDISQSSGIQGRGRGMGVIATDLDDDGRIDIFVANDAQANAFWHNRGDGTFEDRAESVGLAFNAEGQPEANMGVASGDTDGDLLTDLLVTHFFNEHDTLWRGLRGRSGEIFFQDQTKDSGIANETRPLTGWGVAFADIDQDGYLDLFATTGHIRQEPTQLYQYSSPPIVWRNLRDGRFTKENDGAGDYFQGRFNGRGVAAGDLDDDGDLDFVVVHHHRPSVILWNETENLGSRLSIKLRGRKPNTRAIGAKILADTGERTLIRRIDGGGSYLSSNDMEVHFGFGNLESLKSLTIVWPSGQVDERKNVDLNQSLEWCESEEFR